MLATSMLIILSLYNCQTNLLIVTNSFKHWVSVTTSWCTFEVGKGGALANIVVYIIEYISKSLIVVAFARWTTELYTFVI